MPTEENKFITLLTPSEQRAVDNINAVLNGDGSDPESGPGAWSDCGEVDVPVALAALARLSLVPAASLAGGRLPDAFTNALGVLEHLGREGVAEHLEKVARIWQQRLGQIPGLLARAEGLPKSGVEIKADIERLQEQTRRNKAEQQTVLARFGTENSSEQRMLLAHRSGNLDRLNHDYFVRIQALDWVLNGAPTEALSERPVVYHWVDSTQVTAFKEYLAHYHDDQEEALADTAKDHYERWLDTAEPGDQYTVSENDHSLDPYEPSFEVMHVDESEFGHTYQLTFVSTGEALRFGLAWGKEMARQQTEGTIYPTKLTPELDEVLGWPNFKCAGFADLFRAAGHDIPTKAESEQSFILHWLTGLVLKYGAGWAVQGDAELAALREKIAVKGEPSNG